MAENSDKILIGARGWLHPLWQGSFYPDDLPQDWQLAYYANEFPLVVMREQEWLQTEDIAALREDCVEDFRFVVELPALTDGENLAGHIDRIRQLGNQCAGVIIPADQANDCALLAETIPCFIEGETDSLIKVRPGTSLKALRVLMEAALQRPASAPALLVVEGAPPDIELLRNALTMRELF